MGIDESDLGSSKLIKQKRETLKTDCLQCFAFFIISLKYLIPDLKSFEFVSALHQKLVGN